jgi:purine-binding chemotaxis protein CheW
LNDVTRTVVFRLEQQRYALMLAAVERIVRAVAVTPLAQAPAIVLGIVDVEGDILPVLNIRARVGLPQREIASTHQFLIARTAQRRVILPIDEVEGMVERSSAEIADIAGIAPGMGQIAGVIKLEDGLALIYDLDRFLSRDEVVVLETALDRALEDVTQGDGA